MKKIILIRESDFGYAQGDPITEKFVRYLKKYNCDFLSYCDIKDFKENFKAVEMVFNTNNLILVIVTLNRYFDHCTPVIEIIRKNLSDEIKLFILDTGHVDYSIRYLKSYKNIYVYHWHYLNKFIEHIERIITRKIK